MIEQFQVPAQVSHAKELYALGGIITIQLSTIGVAWLRSRKRAPELGAMFDRKLEPITSSLSSLSVEVLSLKAHVIGPDGQNGLRGDVKELKEDVRGILNRERDSSLHKPYRP